MNRLAEIILVEDDPLYQELYTDELCTLGANIAYCSTIDQANLVATELPPDAIIVDIGLPDGDGVELIEGLLSKSYFQNTLVIVVTASNDSKQHERAISAGADRVITKPFEAGAIQQALVTIPMRDLLL